MPVRFGGKGVGLRRGRGPGSSCCWVRVDGPARKESTSCSGVCAVVGVGVDFGFMVDDDDDDDVGSGAEILL